MIIDAWDNAGWYFDEPWWKEAVDYVTSANADAPIGDVPIRGDEMFARFVSYDTTSPESAVLESHRRYADVQTALVGEEAIAVWPTATLAVRKPYDADTDVAHYEDPGAWPVRLELRPGRFAIFLPQDAHMPGLVAGAPCRVKKLVIKVATNLISASRGALPFEGR